MTAIKTIRNYTNRNFIIVTEYIFNYMCINLGLLYVTLGLKQKTF